ncbi:hypothetical protein P7K49_032216 [Saguinus oedipus]|uniref:Uncharacterized protein n=1 Tax=Saguinus oedipus TaxID=9490 RepID=A0ABQ9TYG6_SAGOE|nr:hypothetical protein P7K49_032216 [Saguinus oedipus]
MSALRGSIREDSTRLELGRARAQLGPRCGNGCATAVRAAGMFRKARRVNVRKRNDSEEEERERDEEQEPPPLLPPPGTGEEAGPGGSDRAPGGESLLGPGPQPPSALTPGLGAEAGGGFPGGAEPGNGLKPRKRPRENKEVPRASLLSFQDEEEGKLRASGALRLPHPRRRSQPPTPYFPDAQSLNPETEPPATRPAANPPPPPAFCSGKGRVPALHQPVLNTRLLCTVFLCICYSTGP